LLPVAPYVENQVCGVSFRHPRLVSGGGRLDCWSKLYYFTNSSPSAEGRTRPAGKVAGMTSPLVAGERTPGQDTTILGQDSWDSRTLSVNLTPVEDAAEGGHHQPGERNVRFINEP
jgi:hypothetical protein